MDTLDKYLVKELVIYFLLVLLGISALAVGIDFLSKFWSTGVSFSRAMEIYACKIPQTLQQFVPVAALMATLLVVSAMARQNEILALYAAGISNVRLISTFIAVVASLSTLTFLIFDPLIPVFEAKRIFLERGGNADRSSSIQMESNPSRFWYRSDQLIYNVGAFYSQNNTLQDLKVYLLGPDFQILKKIEAKKAIFEDGDWTLENGMVVDYPLENPFPDSHVFFKMRGIIPEKPSDYKTLKVEETTMRLRDLRRFIERSQRYGVDTTLQKVSYHERVAHIFSPLIFVLLGLAFSLNPLKTQSAAKGVALSFLLVFVYLILSRMTISVGKGGLLPALVAAWLPNMLFLFFAGAKIVKR